MLVCSSTHKTTSSLRSLRVYRPHNWRTVAANASSRGTLGESHIWCRHGLRRWCRRICRTDSTEMLGTTPSRTNARAISAQSHCDRDRPRRSGRSQASLTACTATAGGKGGLTSAAGSVLQALEALGQEPLDPLADVLLGQADLACGPNEGQAVGDGQDRPAAAGQTQRRCGAPEPVLQVMTLFGGEGDHQLRRAATHDDPPVADRAVPLPPRSTEVGRTSRVTISGPQLLGALLSHWNLQGSRFVSRPDVPALGSFRAGPWVRLAPSLPRHRRPRLPSRKPFASSPESHWLRFAWTIS